MTAPRLLGLDDLAAQQVLATAHALGLGHTAQAAAQLAHVLSRFPDHPEVLRLHAGILNLQGQFPEALKTMQRAVDLRPMDPLYHNTLGTVLGTSGDFDGAIRALRRACELQPSLAIAWYNLGVMLTRCVRIGEATQALQRAVELDSANMDARALLGDMLRIGGHVKESAAEYRKVLSERPWTGMAWWGMTDLRTGALKPDDVENMQAALRDNRASSDDRIAIGFALAAALDKQGRYETSLAALQLANAIARSRKRWNAPEFSAGITAMLAAFTPPPNCDNDTELGQEAVFIAGMPRSGTTLVEQILASHSQVEAAGELPYLSLVLNEESRRRGTPFPYWTRDMQPLDWRRLGERYLERTAHWRRERRTFTDKLPGNWMYIGAIRAMLPDARVVVCRRDPLETCFSCYRQLLPDGNEWSRTFEDLAAFWHDFDRTTHHFARQHPSRIYQHDYEAMIANPESAIRGLLQFCGLPFEDACLHFHQTNREVRSPSATQVRQPLRADTAHSQHYGPMLDPLRLCLGMPPFST